MEISQDVKKELLEREIESCRASYYLFQIRAQAAKDVGGLEEAVKGNLANMEVQQKLIDWYEKQIAALGKASG